MLSYFISILFLAERPFNDDNIATDSIITEQEQLLEDINNVSLPDLNLTQVSEQVDDGVPLLVKIEGSNSPVHGNSTNSTSPSDITDVPKVVTPAKVSSTTKKSVSTRKKKISEIK
jgi:hypothetical protein